MKARSEADCTQKGQRPPVVYSFDDFFAALALALKFPSVGVLSWFGSSSHRCDIMEVDGCKSERSGKEWELDQKGPSPPESAHKHR